MLFVQAYVAAVNDYARDRVAATLPPSPGFSAYADYYGAQYSAALSAEQRFLALPRFPFSRGFIERAAATVRLEQDAFRLYAIS